jgi:hypothetical protein
MHARTPCLYVATNAARSGRALLRHGRTFEHRAITLACDGSPPITRITLPACCAHYPGGPNGCLCRLLRRSHGLPRISAGSASALWISRPAQASLALRPAGSLDRQKRPLSRGFGPSGCPSKPLVSYQINRQLSGRYPPPQVTRAFGAHRNEPNLLYRAASISIAPRLNHRRARSPKPGPLISRRPRSELISAVLRGPATNMVSRVWRWQEIGFVSLIRHLK